MIDRHVAHGGVTRRSNANRPRSSRRRTDGGRKGNRTKICKDFLDKLQVLLLGEANTDASESLSKALVENAGCRVGATVAAAIEEAMSVERRRRGNALTRRGWQSCRRRREGRGHDSRGEMRR